MHIVTESVEFQVRIIRDEMDDETFDAVLANINKFEEENIKNKKRSTDSPQGSSEKIEQIADSLNMSYPFLNFENIPSFPTQGLISYSKTSFYSSCFSINLIILFNISF